MGPRGRGTPAPGHPRTTSRPPPGHLRVVSGPPPGHLWTASGPPPGHPWTISGSPQATSRCRAPGPRGARFPVWGAQRPGPDCGGARGAGIRHREPGLPAAAHRGSPRADAASDGRLRPLQWRCGGRGARVTAGGRPKPRPSPDTPRRPAAPPSAQLRHTPSPPFPLLLLFFHAAGLQSVRIRKRRCRK